MMYANDTSITFASGDAEEMNRINLDLNRIEYKYDEDRTSVKSYSKSYYQNQLVPDKNKSRCLQNL